MYTATPTNRFPFLTSFDVAQQKFGGHISSSKQTQAFNDTPKSTVYLDFRDGTWNLGVDKETLTRAYTPIDVSSFDVQNIKS